MRTQALTNAIRNLLEDLCEAQDTATAAEIDASLCQTSSDFRKARDAQSDLDDKREETVKELLEIFRVELQLFHKAS